MWARISSFESVRIVTILIQTEKNAQYMRLKALAFSLLCIRLDLPDSNHLSFINYYRRASAFLLVQLIITSTFISCIVKKETSIKVQ